MQEENNASDTTVARVLDVSGCRPVTLKSFTKEKIKPTQLQSVAGEFYYSGLSDLPQSFDFFFKNRDVFKQINQSILLNLDKPQNKKFDENKVNDENKKDEPVIDSTIKFKKDEKEEKFLKNVVLFPIKRPPDFGVGDALNFNLLQYFLYDSGSLMM